MIFKIADATKFDLQLELATKINSREANKNNFILKSLKIILSLQELGVNELLTEANIFFILCILYVIETLR